jgi:hypothetical protein
MKAGITRVGVSAALVAAGFALAWLLLPWQPGHAQAALTEKALASGLVRAADAVPTRGPWGEWRRYFRGETHGTKDMVVLVVTLKNDASQAPPIPYTPAPAPSSPIQQPRSK